MILSCKSIYNNSLLSLGNIVYTKSFYCSIVNDLLILQPLPIETRIAILFRWLSLLALLPVLLCTGVNVNNYAITETLILLILLVFEWNAKSTLQC